ncbi:hypothetical protein ADK77_23650 [Streptomyces antibioticus]|nr:hypothetical protein ADK77_23650 [Streptomyces antibioticus]
MGRSLWPGSRCAVCTAWDALWLVLFVSVTRAAGGPPVRCRGRLSDTALPRPWTFSSALSAAVQAQAASASTDASNPRARAAAEDAAAEAGARAETIAEAAEEAGADRGVPDMV